LLTHPSAESFGYSAGIAHRKRQMKAVVQGVGEHVEFIDDIPLHSGITQEDPPHGLATAGGR
jgi:hypothetical protein